MPRRSPPKPPDHAPDPKPDRPDRGNQLDRYPRPSVAVDVVALTVADGALYVALYQRKEPPERGSWALPGGFMHIDESPEETAVRVLSQKVGLAGVFLEQLYTFGDVQRDPRGRVVTIAYFALIDHARFGAGAQPSLPGLPGGPVRLLTDTTSARLVVPWPGETGGPVEVIGPHGAALPLFLDHADILGLAVKRLRGKLDYTPIGFQLLPLEFTLRQLQEVHETIRGEPVNKDSFRRRMLQSGQLEATGAHERDVVHRPAELYRFSRRSAT